MGEKQLLLNADELRRISVTCGHCKTALVFDAATEGGLDEHPKCPSCGQLMAGVRTIVLAYRRFYQEFQRVGRDVHIVIALKD